MSKICYITIEGPTGVGKTTLAENLSKRLGWQLELEVFEDNPFLDKYYGKNENCAFQMEMFFLNSRYKQFLKLEIEKLASGNCVIADYHHIKNLVFAGLTLTTEELGIYQDIYKVLFSGFVRENLTIFLNCSVETLQHRLAKRGRSFEQNLNEDYLKRLCSSFKLKSEEFSYIYPTSRKLLINADEVDFVTYPEQLNDIVEDIRSIM